MDCCDRPSSASLLVTAPRLLEQLRRPVLISAYASPYQDYGTTCGGRFDQATHTYEENLVVVGVPL